MSLRDVCLLVMLLVFSACGNNPPGLVSDAGPDADTDSDSDSDSDTDTDSDSDTDTDTDTDSDTDSDTDGDTDSDTDTDTDTDADCNGDEYIELLVDDAVVSDPMYTATSGSGEGTYCQTDTANSGTAVWSSVPIPCAGDWYVLGRVWGSEEDADSMYLTVGSHDEEVWDFNQCTQPGGWSWDYASTAVTDDPVCDDSTLTDPAVFTLAVGDIDVTLRGREVTTAGYNSAVARMYLVTDPDFDPDVIGMGTLDITGPGTPGSDVVGIYHEPGQMNVALDTDISDDFVWAGDADSGNEDGCAAFPAGTFDGVVALIQRGNCNFAQKVNNADDAGAIAVVVFNNLDDDYITMTGDDTFIPSTFVTQTDGEALVAWCEAHADATVTIHAP